MHTPTAQRPNTESLATGLRTVFCDIGLTDGEVKIIDRQPNVYASTFPSEIVTCKFSDGRELQLFCKYAAGCNHKAHGHRGGVEYEASVYRHFLQPLMASTPAFYGMYVDESSDHLWLILEYLDNSQRLSIMAIPPTMPIVQAAHNIGRFHAASQTILSGTPLPLLKLYDAEYYRGWSRRTLEFSNTTQDRFPWLPPLCEQFEHDITDLVASPLAVIHGECYPENILFQDGMIYLIDWESAAFAAGEIDLAMLTERWSDEVARQCEREYQKTRWPMGPPANFERRLNLAQVYLQLRWLGDRPEWTTQESDSWRFERLRSAGTQLGLI